MDEFDFSNEPGKIRINPKAKIEQDKQTTKNEKNDNSNNPLISVIMPFYNDKKYIEQSVNSVLNQTFPWFEFLIIDDGSKDKESLEKLKEIEKLDKRIKVFHKENEGLAATRDFGANKSGKTAKYLMFMDSDDLIEKTFLECAYWTLETNPKAGWAYSDSVGFEALNYTWNKYFDSEKMKKENDLIATALVRKSDFIKVKGYELREKAVNEDWNFWLKLISIGKYPVHMSFYGCWYRRKENGELKKSKDNKKRALEIIAETASKITKPVKAIQYPRYNFNYDLLPENLECLEGFNYTKNSAQNSKENLLFIIPWMIRGGADLFNLNFVKGLSQNITIITTEPNQNILRQEFEKLDNKNGRTITVYDLTTFLDQKYWLTFINYIIKKENIGAVVNSNSKFGYAILPYLKAQNPQISILDYVHMEEWYNRNGGYSRYSGMYSSVIDKTLACNENSRKILIDHFDKSPEEVKTVYIGVDEEKFDPQKFTKEDIKNLRKKYLPLEIANKLNKISKAEESAEPSKFKIISFICRISEQKRPMLFLQILAELKEKRKDFYALVVGDGNLLKSMKEEAQKLDLNKNIKFLGSIQKTEEIYAISDLTVNCSIKEGLALTSYESLSMGVPVVSSDVGGQSELITNDVGSIIAMMQSESDIYSQNYKDEEINNYVVEIDKILNNLNKYKKNCRKKILEGFTIKNMQEKMQKILNEAIENPNEEKVQNGLGLKNNINLTKELITLEFENDEVEYKWECNEYEKKVYGVAYSQIGTNYKKELLKEKLWNIPAWRAFIKIMHKLRG